MKKVAVVTGGTRGIGAAITNKLLQNGFVVYVSSRNNSIDKDLINHKNYHFFQADLSKKEENYSFCQYILEKEEKINILINNVGVFKPGNIIEETDEHFEEMMNLNIFSPYFTTKKLIEALKKSGDSYIFNISSTAGQIAYPNGGTYSITKHALVGFSKVLRKELINFNIPVSNFLPGATLTDSWNGVNLPKDRFIQPENIANLIFEAWENRKYCVVEEIIIRPKLGDL